VYVEEDASRPRAVSELTPDDHACLLSPASSERARLVAGSPWQGIARGERVLYLADDGVPCGLRARLQHHGVDVHALEARRRLDVGDARSTYCSGGRFCAETMFRRFQGELRDARAAGWSGLRVCGDTGWLTGSRRRAPVERFLDYERVVTGVLSSLGVAALRNYRLDQLDPCGWSELRFAGMAAVAP
jgi:hypothetical protein